MDEEEEVEPIECALISKNAGAMWDHTCELIHVREGQEIIDLPLVMLIPILVKQAEQALIVKF